MVVRPALEEALQVGADAGLELRVHGHRLQRGRVGERRRRPLRRGGAIAAGVRVQPQLAPAELHLVGDRLDMLQVRAQHARPVMSTHTQHQALAAAAAVARRPGVGPREAGAEERVVRRVPRPELQREVVGLARRRQHARRVRVLQRRQRRHVRRRLPEQRILHPLAAAAAEPRHLVVLVRLRPLVRPPPHPPHRVRHRLVRQHHPQRHHRQRRVRYQPHHAASAAAAALPRRHRPPL
ncbi:Os10g0519400, partial [Oryza sativa Japonica Group]